MENTATAGVTFKWHHFLKFISTCSFTLGSENMNLLRNNIVSEGQSVASEVKFIMLMLANLRVLASYNLILRLG